MLRTRQGTYTTNSQQDPNGPFSHDNVHAKSDGISASFNLCLLLSIIIDPQKVSNVTVVMPNIPIRYSTAADIVNVTLEWDDESYPTNLERTNLQTLSYTITIYPGTANSGSIFHTGDTSILLPLNYDQDYNISVVATNCVGNSTPAEMRIRLG